MSIIFKFLSLCGILGILSCIFKFIGILPFCLLSWTIITLPFWILPAIIIMVLCIYIVFAIILMVVLLPFLILHELICSF